MTEKDAEAVLEAVAEGIAAGRADLAELAHMAPDDHLWDRVSDAITNTVNERLTALLARGRH